MLIKDYVENLYNQSDKAYALEKIWIEFQDLEVEINRWGWERVYSSGVNPIATDVLIRRSCGCCEDAALYASPYITRYGIQIFSKPYEIYIGGKDWFKTLKNYEISDVVCDKVRRSLDELNKD